MNLLADSAGWLALYDQSDKYHTRARHAFRELAGRKINFIVTDYLIAEAVTLIRGRAGHATAIMCGDWLLNSPRVRLIRADSEVWSEAWRLFKRYDDKEFSFVDCLSFVVMQRERLVEAFTFDHHFKQMGFRMWPGDQ